MLGNRLTILYRNRLTILYRSKHEKFRKWLGRGSPPICSRGKRHCRSGSHCEASEEVRWRWRGHERLAAALCANKAPLMESKFIILRRSYV